jgi:hypothetical protein
MALDIYTWLAQRLHGIARGKPAFVPWVSLKEQFGHGYDRMDNFKRVFRTTLRQVQIVYREAKLGPRRERDAAVSEPPPRCSGGMCCNFRWRPLVRWKDREEACATGDL